MMKNLLTRHFTREGQDVTATIAWGRRHAVIRDASGRVIFEQRDVEFPVTWSDAAVNIVAQKYFRGQLGTAEREWSLRQMVDRVVSALTKHATSRLGADVANVLRDELTYVILHQAATFNSPVWFNLGHGEHPQCSACFINSVEDNMTSIMALAATEARLFKGGSGTGSNLSKLRSSKEPLSGGGSASGPIAFMRGFDAFAGAIKSGGKTRRAAKMVLLDDRHPDLLEFIDCKAVEEKKAWALIDAGYDGNFNAPGGAYDSVGHQNANHSVRLSDDFMLAAQREDYWSLRSVQDAQIVASLPAADVLRRIAQAAWVCGDPGVQFSTTINGWNTCPNSGAINASNPCSEYMFLDDTACNLASINLMRFFRLKLDNTTTFDVEDFEAVTALMIVAMDLLVDLSSYPTTAIAENSQKFRPLGLGYANLGGLLMAMGVAYDSDAGRGIAAGLTALMAARAHVTSVALARELGAHGGMAANSSDTLNVMRYHATAVGTTRWGAGKHDAFVRGLNHSANGLWKEALMGANIYGMRNAQLTVLAPTGTISFMMDCDTTGVEPDIALTRRKTLVGGGEIVSTSRVAMIGLTALGYSVDEIGEISKHLIRYGDLGGCQRVRAEHRAVFDCALPDSTGRSIDWRGHVLMMAAVQPFLSGAISKTVNLPATATVEDVEAVFQLAWRLGLKAIAVYRDGCKRTQPMNAVGSTTSPSSVGDQIDAHPVERDVSAGSAPVERDVSAGSASAPVVMSAPAPAPPLEGAQSVARRRLPAERRSITHKFVVGGHGGYVTVGLYEDGSPGELFISMAKEGSTLAGLMDSFATATSIGLQYGVPLSVFVSRFRGTRFEPAGYTSHDEVKIATSLMDYLFRWLEWRFLAPAKDAARAPQFASAERTAPAHDAAAGPPCPACGSMTRQAGSCYACGNCGTTTGCS